MNIKSDDKIMKEIMELACFETWFTKCGENQVGSKNNYDLEKDEIGKRDLYESWRVRAVLKLKFEDYDFKTIERDKLMVVSWQKK